MQSVVTKKSLKKYQKNILLGIVYLLSMPIIGVLIEIIFTYGNYVGTFIRNISENGMCF